MSVPIRLVARLLRLGGGEYRLVEPVGNAELVISISQILVEKIDIIDEPVDDIGVCLVDYARKGIGSVGKSLHTVAVSSAVVQHVIKRVAAHYYPRAVV